MDRKELLLAFAFGALGVWCWSDLAFPVINCALDQSPVIRETRKILGRGKLEADRYLLLESTSTDDPVKIYISRRRYDELFGNRAVAISIHRGVLGEEWCDGDDVQQLGR